MQSRARRNVVTYAFFLDVEKAYDTVWRAGLWYKLHQKGVRGRMLRCIVNMYSVARYCTYTNGVTSAEFEVGQGVAQGCVLSTTLYDVFVDDKLRLLNDSGAGVVVDDHAVAALMLADDLGGLTAEPEHLQVIIDMCFACCRKWRYKANIPKCAVVVFCTRGRSVTSRVEPGVVFLWGAGSIPIVSRTRYLGVLFSDDCRWDAHIGEVVKKTEQRLMFLSRVFRDRDLHTHSKLQIYKTVVRPLLEYGSEVWCCHNKNQVGRLEALQLRAAKMILHCPVSTSTEAVLLDLGLEPLQDRWDLLKFGWCWKLVSMAPDRTPRIVYDALKRDFLQSRPSSTLFHHVVAPRLAALPLASTPDWQQTLNGWFAQSKDTLKKKLRREIFGRRLRDCRALMASKSQLQIYMHIHGSDDSVLLDSPGMRRYLRSSCAAAGCHLQFQFRAGSALVRELTHKFPSTHPLHTTTAACACCPHDTESVQHLLLDCPAFAEGRGQLLRFFQLFFPSKYAAFEDFSAVVRAAALLDDCFWGSPEVVVPIVQRQELLSPSDLPHYHVQQFLTSLWGRREHLLRLPVISSSFEP